MKKWISQMWLEELVDIKRLIIEWYTIPKIADKIWRDKTTIYRLFEKNGIEYKLPKTRHIWWKGWKFKRVWIEKLPKMQDEIIRIEWKKKPQFNARSLYLKRELRRSIASKRYCKVIPWSKLEWYILEKIKKYWSPKKISWRWRLENDWTLSKDTIYSYIYNNHKYLVSKYFRRKWKKSKKYWGKRTIIQDRVSIENRPVIVNERQRIWDWEADTIVWIRWWENKDLLLTMVDRKSWFLVARKIKNKSWDEVVKATRKIFKKIPKNKRLTITYDNWTEFSFHYVIKNNYWIETYFAHPYSSWERWTNENTNWLLRQFFPKWTDFSNITNTQLQYYVSLINNRPRDRLWFLTPKEVFLYF
jgi:IS30 family transposase